MRSLSLAWVLSSRERGGINRLGGIAAGVAVGVALLLLVLAAYAGLGDRGARSTWALSDPYNAYGEITKPLSDNTVFVATNGLIGNAGELYRGEYLQRTTIAATPGSTVAVPGIEAAPRPGEYYASPALARLIDAAPADELGDRYGVRVGIIGSAGLLGPDSMLAIVGAAPADALQMYGATSRDELTGFAYPSVDYQIIAAIGGIAVLFPVAVLISIVTKLGQAARTERFATVRLMGATPRLVANLAAIEAVVPAIVGSVLGIGLYFVLRPLAALVSIDGSRFFVSDLHVAGASMAAVAIGIPLLAAAVAYATALRQGLGPLGGSREVGERAPRWYALVPLVLGAVLMIGPGVLTVARQDSVRESSLAITGGFLLLLVGLVLAGPYLATRVSRFWAARVRSPAGVLALSRIARHPKASCRSVSGLVLALFVVTVFVVGASTEQNERVSDAPATELLPADALILTLDSGEERPQAEIEEALASVTSTAGVERVLVAARAEGHGGDSGGYALGGDDARALGLTQARGEYVHVPDAYFWPMSSGEVRTTELSIEEAAAARPSFAIILTDGTPDSLERARTAAMLTDLSPDLPPTTRAENATSGTLSWAARYSNLAWVGVLAAMVISVVSLAVATSASMLDRKRVLGLLRLSGMSSSTLKRMIVVETAVPLITVFFLTIGLGYAAAWGLVVSLSGGGRSVALPGLSYLGLLGVCFTLAALAVLSVFRSVRSELPLAATRFE